ncbi:cell wall-binding repeat-containing protein [Paradesulfitobacterium ferrireducens]|uniref:cell wall-binding repeat-containing protein n=1 Tax=Paradesulfitobacterium ferrireducens TaxID=2816476 RepID=UPI001A8E2E6B|nr:cell wall-binding repeat-containing protein [Paradesulfitobacterium ferrireducens]
MRKTKKTLAILAIVAMVLAMLPVQVFAATTSAVDKDRYAGADRIATALDVASNWSKADTVILAPADDDNLVDALAAAPLAGQENAPILLTFKSGLNADVKAKIAALGAKKVYVVGAAANDAVVNAISGATVEKLAGADRWATADAINAKLTNVAGTFVVGYDAIPDALSAASYAAANKYAIVLTNVDGTVNAAKLVGSKTYLVGGTGVVKDYAGATDRFGGADRYATNEAVVKGLTYEFSKVYIANGETLVDALVAAPLAAQAKAAVLLANTSVAGASYVNSKLASDSKVIALGGTGVVSDTLKGNVKYQAPAVLAVESVSAINAEQIQVVFNKAVDETTAEDVTNYKLQNTALQSAAGALTDTASLGADGKTVTITLGKTGALTNKKAYSFTVGTGVKDANGTALGASYSTSWLQSDTTAPTASVNVTAGTSGTQTITVNYSEPVQNAGTYTVDGQSASVTALDANDISKNNQVTITTAQNLVVGQTYTLSIASATDYAGNVLVTTQIPFTVGQAGAGNLVSATQASDTTVKLVFDTKIDTNSIPSAGTNFKVQTLGTDFSTSGGINLAVDSTDTTGKTLIVTVNIPGYTTTNPSITPTITVKGLKGTNGAVINDVSSTVTMTADQTAPTYVGTTVASDNSYILVQMSEKIAAASVTDTDAAKLTVVDADGVDQTANVFGTGKAFDKAIVAKSDGTTPGSDQAYIKFYNRTGAKLAKGTYTITVPAKLFVDTANTLSATGNSNAAFTVNVTVNDLNNTTAITVGTPSAVTVNADGSEYFTLGFGTALNNTALSTANYTVDGKSLPAGTTIAFTDTNKNTVKITAPAGTYTQDGTVNLAVFNVQNSAGSTMSGTALKSLTVKDNTAPTVASAAATAGKINITFSENVAYAGAGTEVSLINADGTTAVASTAISVTGKVAAVTINLSGIDLTKVTLSVASGAFADVSANANTNGSIKNVTVTDTNVTVPTFTLNQVAANKNAGDIQLNIANFDKAKAEGVTSYDVYVYGTSTVIDKTTAANYTVSQNVLVGSITLSGTSGLYTLPTTITTDAVAGTAINYASPVYVTIVAKDSLGNKAYATEVGPTSFDFTAPTVSTALASGNTTGIAAAGTGTITFSEALSAASQTAVQNALTAAVTGAAASDLSFSWAGGTLTITNNNATTAAKFGASNVTATITDAVGNTTTGAIIVTP